MTTVTPPRVGVPIGTAEVSGRTVQVFPHPEYVKYFSGLHARSGGVSGPGTEDLTAAQFEDAGIEETKALLHILSNAAGQAPRAEPTPENQLHECSLREQMNALALRVQALEQGLTA